MNADEIVNRLREYAKHCDGVHSCWNDTTLISAADLIESLQAQLSESQRRERPGWVSGLDKFPRCDKCDQCFHAPSKKCEGYTHYCQITGRDVGQSHFGGNSPRCCPKRKEALNE